LRHRLTLASRILALQIGIVLAVVAAGAVASVRTALRAEKGPGLRRKSYEAEAP